MWKIENPRQAAADLRPGTIVIPFVGDERFDVVEVKVEPWGAVKLTDWWGVTVEMDADNRVEILGHFNL